MEDLGNSVYVRRQVQVPVNIELPLVQIVGPNYMPSAENLRKNIDASLERISKLDKDPALKEHVRLFQKRSVAMMVFTSNKCEKAGRDKDETFRIVFDLLAGKEVSDDQWQSHHPAPKPHKKNRQSRHNTVRSRREIVQLYNAYVYIRSQRSLTIEVIKKTHHILMDGIEDAQHECHAGSFREDDVFVDNWQFPGPEQVDALMAKFVAKAESLISQLNKDNLFNVAGTLSTLFVQIHPFTDGNGRMSRLIMNYVLQYNDLYPFAVSLGLDKHKERYGYYRALQHASSGKGFDHCSYQILHDVEKQLQNCLVNWELSANLSL